MVRFFFRLFFKLAWWQQLLLLAATPLLALNLSVAFFGNSLVSPLSPSHLGDKWAALKAYGSHRPGCLLRGHPQVWPLVAEAEVAHGLPKGLLQAVVDVESEGRPHRISFAGAMGPAQLMPGTARQLDVDDPFDTRQAIDGSARYLAQLFRRTGDVTLAVASYNAGPGAVRGAVPRNGETELYVAKVMRRFSTGRD